MKEEALPFFKEITYHIIRTGRRHLAAECFEILLRIGDQETKDQITDQMIQILKLEDRENEKIDISKLDKRKLFADLTYLHLACINQN